MKRTTSKTGRSVSLPPKETREERIARIEANRKHNVRKIIIEKMNASNIPAGLVQWKRGWARVLCPDNTIIDIDCRRMTMGDLEFQLKKIADIAAKRADLIKARAELVTMPRRPPAQKQVDLEEAIAAKA